MAEKKNTTYVQPEVTQEEIERERRHQEKEYLGPREMAAYIISGITDEASPDDFVD